MAAAGDILVRCMDLLAGKIRAGVTTLELDEAADVDVGDAGEAQRGQRALDRDALGVEDPGLGANEDARPHAAVRAIQSSNGSPVMRS